ncbi:Tat pathway signal protein [Burkholderiaceae bacterium FT117]|uniref:Acg family FMN-binding oxidoreductase n=1 Tax=Zeimonas sediminis TaxID=2944268 RepID=UPI002342D52F|nr:Tat pathway signal protein [Zeimonas sediminis]MCM5570096.1 Tat pathway signal protein [Zeimonas sediminis]
MSRYDEAVRDTWRHAASPAGASREALFRELVRYATLAPSSHNTQCWKFRLAGDSITILPDFDRRCPVVDPDDHHLFVSLGCATENLLQAAAAFGLRAEPRFATGRDPAIEIALTPAAPERSALFDAIPLRQSTRCEYDGKPLSASDLRLLEAAGDAPGVRLRLITARPEIEKVLEYVVAGNTAQMRDPDFVRELERWIRFGDAEAIARSDGLFSRSSGNPAAPRWLGRRLFRIFFREKTENDKYARQLRSSAGVAVFSTESSDPGHWVEAGRAFERFALQATALGVRTAHLNQPVEVAQVRAQFSAHLGVAGGRPDLVIRFGRGPEMPRSLRRPVDAVLA